MPNAYTTFSLEIKNKVNATISIQSSSYTATEGDTNFVVHSQYSRGLPAATGFSLSWHASSQNAASGSGALSSGIPTNTEWAVNSSGAWSTSIPTPASGTSQNIYARFDIPNVNSDTRIFGRMGILQA
jgi:hypothetical protein